jgi:hypothetical protein
MAMEDAGLEEQGFRLRHESGIEEQKGPISDEFKHRVSIQPFEAVCNSMASASDENWRWTAAPCTLSGAVLVAEKNVTSNVPR